MDPIVIIGGGHAAAQLCAELAAGQHPGPVVLVSQEPHLPYHRPPLSKGLIKDPAAALPELRNAAAYEQAGIELRLGVCAIGIDRAAQRVRLRDAQGQEIEQPYAHLVLATGSRARLLPDVPMEAEGVHSLRSYDDALRLRTALHAAEHVMVLGGGFIGLEVAASARGLGKQVTVFEAAPRLLVRGVSPLISEHLLKSHLERGVDVRLGTCPERVVIEDGRFVGAEVRGQLVKADLLLIGIGALPETSLAQAAGLACGNGVVVDALLHTSDPHISAIGDCTSFPYGPTGEPLRLESVQNANDQARALAARLLGKPQPYAPVPWFWSDQGDVRLQIVGLWRPEYESVVRAGAKAGSFSVFHYLGDELKAVESINAPMDHLTAKKWLPAGHSPARASVGDASVDLKTL